MEVVVENPEDEIPKDCVEEPGSAKPRDPRGKPLGDEKRKGSDGAEIFPGKGVDSGNLDDSEMNGVSSLLKMKRRYGEKENANPSVKFEKNTSVEQEEDSEEEEEEEHGFQVGDFVWGKIKSHPWWPGQIYDSSDASDLALKIKRKGRLLVAYFGDWTFAWCRPSQLKAFEENFKELSRISSSRAFVNAVGEAVEEMGKHVELLMSGHLGGDEGVVRPVAASAGMKEGVVVPNVRREIISSLSFEPREILGEIEALSKNLVFSDLLELEVLKRKLSAFYRSKGAYGLIEYHEAQPIPGLEDRDVDRAVKVCCPKGLSEEDGLSPVKPNQRSLEQCSGFPEHRLHSRRKQKSIAEIMETDRAAQVEAEAEATSAGRKKRKRGDEVKDIEKKASTSATTAPRSRKVSKLYNIENAGPEQKDDYSKEKTFSRKRRKRVADVGDDASEKKEETAHVEDEYSKEKTLSGKGKISGAIVGDDASEKREETTHVEESDKNKTLHLEDDGGSTSLASLRRKVKVDVPSVQMGSGNDVTKVQTENDSLSREKKKSKYLSPPYTSEVGWKTGRNEIKVESLKVSSQTRAGERMTDTAGNVVAGNGGIPSDKPGETSDLDSGHQEPSGEFRKAIDFLKSESPAKDVRDQICETALSPQYPKGDSLDHMMREFISIYRSFTYRDGANNKMHPEQTSDKENVQNKREQNETSKPSKKKDKKSVKKPKVKHQMEEKKAETEERDLCAELLVTFGPGSSLPRKDDLIKLYRKFGPLNEERTNMFYNNFCARVAFMNLPDAEAAFDSSLEKCPFITSSATKFRLKLPSGEPGKSNERTTEKKPENQRIELEYVKEKLGEIRSMLDNTDGGMTIELKVKLENEMRNLLEKVNKIVFQSS